MSESQQSTNDEEIMYTQPPMDITTEMMSPATTALLANMNMSMSVADSVNGAAIRGGGGDTSVINNSRYDNNNNSHDIPDKERRRPLNTLHNKSTNNYNNTNHRQQTKSINRRIGPNEQIYKTQYSQYVSKTIAQYTTKKSTNLRGGNDTLPKFSCMNKIEQQKAMDNVDNLLERLNNSLNVSSGVNNSGVNSGQGTQLDNLDNVDINATASGRTQPSFSRVSSSKSNNQQQQKNDETFGSATTLGEGQHNETFGSATTLGLNNNSVRQSTGSATTLGNNNKSNHGNNNTTLGDETTLNEGETTILEESMALLSDDEIGGLNGHAANHDHQEDDESSVLNHGKRGNISRQSNSMKVAPIERTRHYQNPYNNSTSAALQDDEMLDTSTPPFSTNKLNKRCASNSGKRGLKSRHRGENEEEEDEDLIGNFSGIGADDEMDHDNNNNGMYLHEQDDIRFSCGSPIQRCFSDDLEIDGDGDSEMRDSLHDLPSSSPAHRQRAKSPGKTNVDDSESDCYFSQQGNNDDEDEHIDFGNGNDDYYNDEFDNAADDDDGGMGDNQMSQWNTFHNADAKFTDTQMEGCGGDEEDESPVRRRAIRFDAATQKKMTLKKKQQQSQRKANARSKVRVADDEDENANEEDDIIGRKVVAVSEDKRKKKKSSKKKKGKGGGDDDPIESVRNLCRRAKTAEEQGVESLEEVAPIDVRVRDGMYYRVDPLRCRQNKNKSKATKKTAAKSKKDESSDSDNSLSDPEPSFKDPLSDFPSRVSARLNAGLDFLIDKESGQSSTTIGEEDDHDKPSAVLLSMTIKQIVCVTSKLLVQTKKSARLHQQSKNGTAPAKRYTPSSQASPPKDDDYLAGGTLIVLRGKEDIEQWEVALREYTSLSVLNHAGIQSSIRKLASTAGKCAGYDIVLTTYDSLKTKEVTIPVDSSGVSILGGPSSHSKSNDGWLTSRDAGTQSGASAKQKCHQMSVLHRMSWHRVIFIDELGRKGFLIKPGTARAQASVAINSNLRLIFFEKEEEVTNSKDESKFKDDRRQLRSIVTTLHLPEKLKLDKFVGSYVLDVKKAIKTSELDLLDETSSEEEESVSECDSDEY